eukprot:380594-Pelagomonas_calceolata.AAC.7
MPKPNAEAAAALAAHWTTGCPCLERVRLVIEHCDRGCLRTALDEEVFLSNTGLNYAAILDSASDIARAMLHLHCNDVVHADVSVRGIVACMILPYSIASIPSALLLSLQHHSLP